MSFIAVNKPIDRFVLRSLMSLNIRFFFHFSFWLSKRLSVKGPPDPPDPPELPFPLNICEFK